MRQKHDAYAVFGQVDYDLTAALTLTTGLRYTHEDKNMSGVFTQGTAPDYVDNVIALPVVLEQFYAIAPQDPVDASLSDDRVTGTVKLSRTIGLDAMAYLSYATGYKSGGTNTDRINPALDYVFDPETSEALELGVKADFPDQALRLNAALHRTDVQNLQVVSISPSGLVLQNVGEVKAWGGEVELTWLPFDSLALTGSYSRTDGKAENWDNDICWIAARFHTGRPDPGDPTQGADPAGCDRSGDDLPFNPDLLILTANQSFNVTGGIDGFLLIEYSHTGDAEVESHDPYLRIPAYNLVNLRLGFQLREYDSTITLWGRNVLNEKYRMAGYDPIDEEGRVLATPREPATYGITLRMNF